MLLSGTTLGAEEALSKVSTVFGVIGGLGVVGVVGLVGVVGEGDLSSNGMSTLTSSADADFLDRDRLSLRDKRFRLELLGRTNPSSFLISSFLLASFFFPSPSESQDLTRSNCAKSRLPVNSQDECLARVAGLLGSICPFCIMVMFSSKNNSLSLLIVKGEDIVSLLVCDTLINGVRRSSISHSIV